MNATFGISGHGLLVTPVHDCRVLLTNDHLVLARGKHEVARFVPGKRVAYEDPTWVTPTLARFGDGGPTLALADGVKPADVFLQIDTLVGSAGSLWRALGGGFITDLPKDVLLLPAKPGEKPPFFEFHVMGGKSEFIWFSPVKQEPDSIHIGAAEGQRFVTEDVFVIELPDGDRWGVRYKIFEYEHQGSPWRQMRAFVPMGTEWTMVVSAQAKTANAGLLFDAARTIACSIEPLA